MRHNTCGLNHLVYPQPDTTGLQFGLELECEGNNLPTNNFRYWKTTNDGSLRGESAEYVSSKPVPNESVVNAINSLWEKFQKNDTKLSRSYRTSYHVHLNCQDLTYLQALNVFLGFTMIEPVLEQVVGDNRVNNVFCISPRSSGALFDSIYKGLKQAHNPLFNFRTNDLRYSSINLCSLFKFGTIEIRLMSGNVTKEDMLLWTKACGQVHQYFSRPDLLPHDIVEMPSFLGLKALSESIFSEDVQKYLGVDNLDNTPHIQRSVFEATRCFQAIAYEFREVFEEALNHSSTPPAVPIGSPLDPRDFVRPGPRLDNDIDNEFFR